MYVVAIYRCCVAYSIMLYNSLLSLCQYIWCNLFICREEMLIHSAWAKLRFVVCIFLTYICIQKFDDILQVIIVIQHEGFAWYHLLRTLYIPAWRFWLWVSSWYVLATFSYNQWINPTEKFDYVNFMF